VGATALPLAEVVVADLAITAQAADGDEGDAATQPAYITQAGLDRCLQACIRRIQLALQGHGIAIILRRHHQTSAADGGVPAAHFVDLFRVHEQTAYFRGLVRAPQPTPDA